MTFLPTCVSKCLSLLLMKPLSFYTELFSNEGKVSQFSFTMQVKMAGYMQALYYDTGLCILFTPIIAAGFCIIGITHAQKAWLPRQQRNAKSQPQCYGRLYNWQAVIDTFEASDITAWPLFAVNRYTGKMAATAIPKPKVQRGIIVNQHGKLRGKPFSWVRSIG